MSYSPFIMAVITIPLVFEPDTAHANYWVGTTVYPEIFYQDVDVRDWVQVVANPTFVCPNCGIWARKQTFSTKTVTTTVSENYQSYWDAFWAQNGTGKTVTESVTFFSKINASDS